MIKSVLLLLFFAGEIAHAQSPRKLTQDSTYQLEVHENSEWLFPSGYDSTKKYPLLIFLPFTGGTGADYFYSYANDMDELMEKLFDTQPGEKSFIVLIPGDAGSEDDHSWQGFEACISRYEKRIFEDIASTGSKINIDTGKIVLTGFSLGGDLSWAITQRYPEKFKGAIISGSRCSYSEKGMMARQSKKGFKYYLAMGNDESETRLEILNGSVSALNKAGVQYKYTRMEGEHEACTIEQLREAVEFILFSK